MREEREDSDQKMWDLAQHFIKYPSMELYLRMRNAIYEKFSKSYGFDKLVKQDRFFDSLYVGKHKCRKITITVGKFERLYKDNHNWQPRRDDVGNPRWYCVNYGCEGIKDMDYKSREKYDKELPR